MMVTCKHKRKKIKRHHRVAIQCSKIARNPVSPGRTICQAHASAMTLERHSTQEEEKRKNGDGALPHTPPYAHARRSDAPFSPRKRIQKIQRNIETQLRTLCLERTPLCMVGVPVGRETTAPALRLEILRRPVHESRFASLEIRRHERSCFRCCVRWQASCFCSPKGTAPPPSGREGSCFWRALARWLERKGESIAEKGPERNDAQKEVKEIKEKRTRTGIIRSSPPHIRRISSHGGRLICKRRGRTRKREEDYSQQICSSHRTEGKIARRSSTES